MKKMLILSLCCSLLCVATGCNGSLFKDNSVIPEDVAGIWKNEDSGWEMEISRNGKVLWAVVSPGRVKVKPNETVKVEMRDGQFSTYEGGDFNVSYDPSERLLSVEIELKRLMLSFGDDTIVGNNQNVFSGNVSKDGKTWQTTRMELFDYGDKFPMDPDAVGEAMTFVKVDE